MAHGGIVAHGGHEGTWWSASFTMEVLVAVRLQCQDTVLLYNVECSVQCGAEFTFSLLAQCMIHSV